MIYFKQLIRKNNPKFWLKKSNKSIIRIFFN